ncbi:MAG: HD domain-containing protein [Sedimentisphaerales bacterium]|nr:HD domain-containing protein [Sedimentisphaerales bacterium]MBN2844276.1 HD domain-containing protein [Sedimentisphaerales bacterium]
MPTKQITEIFAQVTTFIIEAEKLKNIYRQSKIVGLDRQENSAEHSWQVTLLALTLAPYSINTIDPFKVVKMLLIHDLVEIDAGDKMIYSKAHDDFDNELKAAKRIFGLLPDTIRDEYLALWTEFELRQTNESKFAYALDRLMPVLQNLNNPAYQTWTHHNISKEQVLLVNAAIAEAHPEIWEIVKGQINTTFTTP